MGEIIERGSEKKGEGEEREGRDSISRCISDTYPECSSEFRIWKFCC